MKTIILTCLLPMFFSTQSAAAEKAAGPSSPQITGKWRRNCYASQVYANEYSDETLEFMTNGQFHRDLRRYHDKECFSPSLEEEQTMDGTYTATGANAGAGPGVYDLDLSVQALGSTALGTAAVNLLNKTNYCNISDWQNGLKRNLLGFPCFGQVLVAGSQIHDLVKLDGRQLYLGKTSFLHDGSSPISRPTTINAELPFQREAAVSH